MKYLFKTASECDTSKMLNFFSLHSVPCISRKIVYVKKMNVVQSCDSYTFLSSNILHHRTINQYQSRNLIDIIHVDEYSIHSNKNMANHFICNLVRVIYETILSKTFSLQILHHHNNDNPEAIFPQWKNCHPTFVFGSYDL